MKLINQEELEMLPAHAGMILNFHPLVLGLGNVIRTRRDGPKE